MNNAIVRFFCAANCFIHSYDIADDADRINNITKTTCHGSFEVTDCP
jgi:hypothetical protein